MPPGRAYITVVSGVPRSGTSLMMRMLEAGGIPALADHRRPADEHNPHGYFEDQRVRRLARDSSWMAEAQGKSLKVIYRLLAHLPPQFDYRVLFMHRGLDEVYDSQQKMLIAAGDETANQDRGRMIRALSADIEKTRDWLTGRANLRTLDVQYRDLVRQPQTSIREIALFLDNDLDQEAMAAVVDPRLYRNRG